jgi:hypothetical protein
MTKKTSTDTLVSNRDIKFHTGLRICSGPWVNEIEKYVQISREGHVFMLHPITPWEAKNNLDGQEIPRIL